MKIFSGKYIKRMWCVICRTFVNFNDDNGLKLSASLAYYTIFSIAPLLILIISLADMFFGEDAAEKRLYPEIAHYIGSAAALQIQNILQNIHLSGRSGFGVIIGVIALFLGASGIFIEIQDSLNRIWRVKAKPKRGWLKMIENRILSFSLIISLGFLLLASLIISLVTSAVGDWIDRFIPVVTDLLLEGINMGITFIIISSLFAIIFKFLPDAKIKWKEVRSGAFFTAVLFMAGQYVITLYIQYQAKSSVYGAAGSIMVILIWIYYAAAILYIGAEYTQVYAEAIGSKIEPADYAVYLKQTEVEKVVSTLPAQNPEIKGNLKEE